MESEKKTRKFRGLKIGLGVLVGLILLVLIALRLILTPSFLTSAVNRYAPQFVDANLRFGQVEATVFRSFPNVCLVLTDAALTYPHDRYAAWDSVGVKSFLRSRGRGEQEDTLASFRRLSASVNLPRLVSGRIHLRDIELAHARIFAHQYDSLTANWNIFKSSSEEKTDTASAGLPHIILHRITLSDRPVVVYTAPSDTLFATLRMKETAFRGRFDLADPDRHRLHLQMDSLFVAGRLPADTLALRLTHLGLDQQEDGYDIDLAANARLRMHSLGRLRVPLTLSGRVAFPERDFKTVSVRNLAARIATVSLRGEADVALRTDSTYVRAELSVDTCSVDKTVKYLSSNLFPAASKLHTDAVISLTALCDGWYIPSRNALPELVAELVVPKAAMAWDGLDYKGRVGADINAQTDRYGRLDVTVNEMNLDMQGVSVSGAGSAEDVLCGDPLMQLDVVGDASLGRLGYLLPEGITAEGDLELALSGMILLSDMSLYNFGQADLEGFVNSDAIRVQDQPDSLFAYLGPTSITLGKAGEGAALGADRLGLKGSIDSLYATYGDDWVIEGRQVQLTAQNADQVLSEEYGREVHPIVGSLSARHLTATGQDSLFVSIRGSRNQFKYSSRPDEGKTLPILAVNSANRGLFVRSGYNRLGLRNANLSGSAVMRGSERRVRREHLLDSLQRVYPDVERDSLLRYHFRRRQTAQNLPDYLKVKDFQDSDIKIDLGESVSSYFRDWTLNGSLDVASGRVVTPYLPLSNRLEKVKGSFNNNELHLDNLTFRAGKSDLTAAGKVVGLRRAMSGRGTIKVDLALTSDLLDANELLPALDAGTRFKPETLQDSENLTDDAYMEAVVQKADTTQGRALLVVPSNLDATLTLQGNRILYSDLDVSWFASDIRAKHRTLQVTNTLATSNMGDIYFEGFYAARTKQDIAAGFDLNLVDITAEKVITLMPQVDSIMPMLKSFQGNLDCELAATAQLDTAMNILPPSINGVMKIKGTDLAIHDNDAFRKVARILMFKDKEVGRVETMSVHGLVGDSMLEIFPFVLTVDRYSLAMSGLQGFDTNFDYHVSVLKSPLPFRFGVDLYGNFDDWKWKLVRPRYKDANVPAFTQEINNVQLNLVSSIHNIFTRGVEEAVRAHQQGADQLSTSVGKAGLNGPDVSLDDASARQLDSLRHAYEHPEQADSLRQARELDALLNAKIDAELQSARAETEQPKECWLKRLFTCKKKDARKEDEQ